MALGALIALVAAGIATAEKPVTGRAGNLEFTFNGGFSPKALSKTTPTPIALTASGSIRTVDGTQPPPLKESIIYTDKGGAINVKGYPTCTSGELQTRDTKTVEGVCGDAIIGKGTTSVLVALPEQRPIPAKSPLLVFNGGESGGVTTLYIHAYLTQPIVTAIVTTVKITKVNKGRYGLKSVASIPLIANGSGSLTDFSLKIDKKFTYKGKKVSVLSAKCLDGKIQANATAVFRDNTRVEADIIRTCTSKP